MEMRVREVEGMFGSRRVVTSYNPGAGTTSVTFLAHREWTVGDVITCAQRLLRIPQHYRLRLNELNRSRVIKTMSAAQRLHDVARSPLSNAYYNPKFPPLSLIQTALEVVAMTDDADKPSNAVWLQVVLFSLPPDAARKLARQTNALAPKLADGSSGGLARDVLAQATHKNGVEVELRCPGHVTWLLPHEGVDDVFRRVSRRLPTHLLAAAAAKGMAANLSNDEKAFYLEERELPPWRDGDGRETSELFARVGRIMHYQRNLSYTRLPTLGFEVPHPQANRQAKKFRRLEEGIRINC